MDLVFQGLDGPQDLLDRFDARVNNCGSKLEQVAKFVEKYQQRPSTQLKKLMTEALRMYADCAEDFMVQVEFAEDQLEVFEGMIQRAPKKVNNVMYLPAKLLERLSKIATVYTYAFGGFRRWVDIRARVNVAEWDALLRREPLHRHVD